MLYAHPTILNKNIEDETILLNNFKNIEGIYQQCKIKKKVLIEYSGYDLETNSKRRVKIAQPILVNYKFKGMILWERSIEAIF